MCGKSGDVGNRVVGHNAAMPSLRKWLVSRIVSGSQTRADRAALPRAQEHPAYCAIHGACAGAVQEFLAGFKDGPGLARVREAGSRARKHHSRRARTRDAGLATSDEMLHRVLFHRALKSTRLAQLLTAALVCASVPFWTKRASHRPAAPQSCRHSPTRNRSITVPALGIFSRCQSARRAASI